MSEILAADGYPVDALRLTQANIEEYSLDLVGQVTQFCDETGQKFDLMGMVPRGSYGPGNIISRRTGFTAPYLVHFCMTSYSDCEVEVGEEFEKGQMPDVELLKGKDLLVIDEVCHTGGTMQEISDYCEAAGVNSIRFATLFLKSLQSKFTPDFWVKETEKWIVFPWEPHEKAGKESTVRRRTPAEIARINARLALQSTSTETATV